jgi:hypothetical protein
MSRKILDTPLNRCFHDPRLALDTPIYRFLPWRWAKDFLVDGNLALVRPENWDDPFELINHPFRIQVSDRHGRKAQRELMGSDFQVFSQSWTTANMADTMLRAYSKLTPGTSDDRTQQTPFAPEFHENEAIQISTTIGKLLAAIDSSMQDNSAFEYLYMVKVAYMSETALAERVVSTYAHGPDTGEDPACVASLLSVKRDAYIAENEVRPIVMLNDLAKNYTILKIKIDPQHFIDSISIDPRIGSHRIAGTHISDYTQRHEFLENWGFGSKIKRSSLYSRSPIFDAILDLDAPDCKLSDSSKERWRKFLEEHHI